MRHHDDRSSSDIEREVAAKRAEVSATVEEIKGRLSPGEFLDQMLRDAHFRVQVRRGYGKGAFAPGHRVFIARAA